MINIEETRHQLLEMRNREKEISSVIYREILDLLRGKEELVLKAQPYNYPCPDIVAIRDIMCRGHHTIQYRRASEDGYDTPTGNYEMPRNLINYGTSALTLLLLYEAAVKTLEN